MGYGVFDFLRKNKMLSPASIKEINEMFDSFELVSKGVSFQGTSLPVSSLFRGFSFLRFYEILLNALIKNKILTIEDANEILLKSKQAGGTRISGYNVIVLDVEILNHLLRKGQITKKEGQQIIDNAKVKQQKE
jgi:hypothetical protein